MVFGKAQIALITMLSLALASCGGTRLAGTVGGDLPPPDQKKAVYEYRIAANDRLSVSVFPAKDLSMPSIRVDATGALLFPPTGMVMAEGKTARELGAELQQKLAACCLRQPQVLVQVEETTSQQVTISGAVVEEGVYNMTAPTTLLQALTFAKGPEKNTANIKRIAVYRMTGGQRTGAIFNLEDIRAGRAADPAIYGGDMIIVDSSEAKSIWRNAITAVPFLGVFTAF